MGFDAANSTNERPASAGLGAVRGARAGLFRKFPDTTRVVLDLERPLAATVQPLPDKTLFAVVLDAPPGSVPQPVPPPARPQVLGGSLRGLVIVVDAGHGGHDLGAPGPHSLEKDLALDIARRLRRELEDRGATVLMTRDGDYFISLQGRCDFANSRHADIFFSVHINSFKPASTGTQTFFWTAQSAALAQEVHRELVRATGLPDRGVTQTRFFVIRKTLMPSVLTETAFNSNPAEEALLLQPAWRGRVAQGMAQGISNYAALYQRRIDGAPLGSRGGGRALRQRGKHR